MSNACLRRGLERTSPALIAWLMDNGYVHDDGGILEFSYYGYCHPREVLQAAATAVTFKTRQVPVPDMKIVRERL